jgi:hypothetical protein
MVSADYRSPPNRPAIRAVFLAITDGGAAVLFHPANPLLEMVCAENNRDHFGKNLFPMAQAEKANF